jgi:hypothetical protein
VNRGTRRVIVLAAVVTLHVVVLVLFPRARHSVLQEDDHQHALQLVLVMPAPAEASARPEAAPLVRRRRVRAAAPAAAKNSQAARRGAPDEAQPPERAPIDWRQQLAGAAQRQIRKDEDLRRQASALAPPRAPASFRKTPHRPPFGWYYAATHRVESLPEGGFLIHINDRCVIGIFIMVMPACTFEHIEARGDLFQHMKDDLSPEATGADPTLQAP